MMIRCSCGNETSLMPGGKPGYFLRDEAWYDKATGEVRCPKCKNAALPVQVIDASTSPVKVQLVPGRSVPKPAFWS